MRDIILTAKTLKEVLERHEKDTFESLSVLEINLDDAERVAAIKKNIEKLQEEWDGIFSLFFFCLYYDAVIIIEYC